MIYADTSALLKLVVVEPETPRLRRWLADRDDRVVTNDIGVVELLRAAGRVSPDALAAARLLLPRLDRLGLTPAALATAASLAPASVRTLDAVHLGSALELRELSVLLTYDARLAEAARANGLPVEAP